MPPLPQSRLVFPVFPVNLSRMPLRRNQIVVWVVPGILWLWLFYHLHSEWTLDARYNYGWAVPFLALLIFYLRSQQRPRPGEGVKGNLVAAFSFALLALLLPLRVIEEANPDWRLLSWTLALVVAAFSLLFFARLGGRAWASHFAFPVCFPLVAVPWPVQFENFVVQNMTRAVAYAAVEIAGWMGLGAFQSGNIIQLHNGFVGVDEACSGVKTLQAGIMVSLVLGEIFRMRPRRRLGLIFFGCGWVFLCNVARATTLVIVAATAGLEALSKWHDLIGTLAMVLGMAGMLGLAWRWKSPPAESASTTIAAAHPIRPRGAVAALAWLIALFGLSELWYHQHERQLLERPRWEARWSQSNSSLRLLPIPETTRAILHYDEARSAAWEDPRGVVWWSFFAQWRPQRAALQLVRSHSPEICLPAVGRTFLREATPVNIQAGPIALRFRAYEFEHEQKPLFVFVCIQDDKVPAAVTETNATNWNLQGRLLAAWHGERNLGQRLLEIAVIGLPDLARAKEAAAKTVAEIVAAPQPRG
ncbi:MAG: hypothetical protein QOD12_1891 [Verrucomicrobiota bacterium]|jgi:exosortase